MNYYEDKIILVAIIIRHHTHADTPLTVEDILADKSR